ncbi:hypothetical protein L5G28_07600 [Gordonia sp. HY285]|uniref:hypothetical protein n=1 Tax=Gordonia liuliyuniae TaxID=2911517 RepID=UPI001F465CDC|nr:hypothetical protein [Gordonia liuliyuniae]MCF8610025.1 hypothetical protein [Gordonia liuliyuniae]
MKANQIGTPADHITLPVTVTVDADVPPHERDRLYYEHLCALAGLNPRHVANISLDYDGRGSQYFTFELRPITIKAVSE